MVEVVVALVVALSSGTVAGAAVPSLPVNDLNILLALTGVPTPAPAPLQDNAQPPLTPAPRAVCGAGSRSLAGVQGRVPAAAVNSADGARGWTCNINQVGHYSSPGGFRVWRYVDLHGHVCAFYDTSLTSPLNVVRLGAGPSPGVAVLDMSDPAHPVKTAMLTSLPMLAPHESLNLNARRGLLAANMGNGGTAPGLMTINSVSQDCRHPVLDATVLAARFGHESGFSPDGNTYWIAGGEGIAAVDIRDPQHPRTVWEGNVFAHGLNLSDDGNRLYDADPINGNLVILDVSEIQAGAPHPVVREISRLTWDTVTIPQSTAPMLIGGKRYLLEFDEFGFRFSALPPADTVGAARIIDVSDEAHPRVVSNLRLEVNQPAGTRRPMAIRRHCRLRCSATPRTTARSRGRSTRRSSPARSSTRDCASSTFRTRFILARSRTSSRRRRRSTGSPAISPCLNRRSSRAGASLGAATRRPVSIRCASTRAFGPTQPLRARRSTSWSAGAPPRATSIVGCSLAACVAEGYPPAEDDGAAGPEVATQDD